MKIKDQVCSFEQARKLYDLGLCDIDTHLSFIATTEKGTGEKGTGEKGTGELIYKLGFKHQYNCAYIPAYTVAELGVLLAKKIMLKLFSSFDDTFYVGFKIPDDFGIYYFYAETEAQARAKALIWLIENKYIDVGDLKL